MNVVVASNSPMPLKLPRARCACGLRTPNLTKCFCRWICATLLEVLIAANCWRRSGVTARAYFHMRPLATGTPTFFLEMDTLWNPRVACSRGMHGDVLDHVLFALALQRVVERIREIDLELHLLYLDDGTR